MNVTVELYGRLAEAVGPRLLIDAAAIHAVGDLRVAIATAHPALAADMMRARVHACVDDAIVPDTTVIGGGATVAFFPPLSGG